MKRRDRYLLLFVVVLFAFALAVVFPADKGALFKKPFQLGLDLKGGSYILYEADLSKKDPTQTDAQVMAAVQQKIERRVNGLGITEPIIQIQGSNRMLVQLPGVKDVNEAIKTVGQVALLEFKEQTYDDTGAVKKDVDGNTVWTPAIAANKDGQLVALTGKFLKPNAAVTVDSTGQPEVAFEWNADGAVMFEQITKRNVNKPLAIFLDNQLISAPTVLSVISDKGVINNMTADTAKKLAIQLNSGSLDVPLRIIQQTDVDATLGADSLHRSLRAGYIGIACLILFMVIYYRLPGALASLALCIYAAILLAIFKLLPGYTLTLPGIAGFIISTGMAVDANVLIFERLKEELRLGLGLNAAVREGFHRAWPSIWMSNVSTFITCIILYWFGSTFGAAMVKGFALTLFLGVAVSMFSAITVTRTFLAALVDTGAARHPLLYGMPRQVSKEVAK